MKRRGFLLALASSTLAPALAKLPLVEAAHARAATAAKAQLGIPGWSFARDSGVWVGSHRSFAAFRAPTFEAAVDFARELAESKCPFCPQSRRARGKCGCGRDYSGADRSASHGSTS